MGDFFFIGMFCLIFFWFRILDFDEIVIFKGFFIKINFLILFFWFIGMLLLLFLNIFWLLFYLCWGFLILFFICIVLALIILFVDEDGFNFNLLIFLLNWRRFFFFIFFRFWNSCFRFLIWLIVFLFLDWLFLFKFSWDLVDLGFRGIWFFFLFLRFGIDLVLGNFLFVFENFIFCVFLVIFGRFIFDFSLLCLIINVLAFLLDFIFLVLFELL